MVGGEYLDDFIYTAVEPLIQRGFKIIKVENNFQNEQPQINDVCVGSVEFTCEFFNRIGIKIPKPLGYPKELNEFFARKIDKRLLSSIIPKEYPIFIKPTTTKFFTGSVVQKPEHLDLLFLGIPKDTYDRDTLEVFTSEPINIVSEYRAFVHHGKVVGLKHYAGDYMRFIKPALIGKVIRKFERPPVAYTVDVGLTDTEKTILIELNDFWALGGYGLDGKTYVRCLIDRFNEIKGLKR